ncbi:cannabinoid receptor 2 [Protopterus annectens]|uniref:cannabinoid receptor 2 n=1 Tax=Protopterus annectens TaxID=7888 RepID=UPI001CFA7945|nr:cannabinoid receptor 2 [Protopterus annectens]
MDDVYKWEDTKLALMVSIPNGDDDNQTVNESKCGINYTNSYLILQESQKTTITIIFAILGTLTFLENAFMLSLILTSKRLRNKPSYLFLSSLALADLFASILFSYSFLEFHISEQNESKEMFLFKLGSVTMCFTASVGSLLLTAVDRYVCIQRPADYKSVVSKKSALIALAVLWSITMIISYLPLMGWNCCRPNSVCSKLFPYVDNTYLAYWVCFVIVVLVLIVYAYIHILWKAHQHTKYMKRHQHHLNQRQVKMRMDIKLAKTLGVILLILITCWSPVLAFMVHDLLSKVDDNTKKVFAFCCTLCLLNSMVNPLLYGLRSRDLRMELKNVFSSNCRNPAVPECSQDSDGTRKTSPIETICDALQEQESCDSEATERNHALKEEKCLNSISQQA